MEYYGHEGSRIIKTLIALTAVAVLSGCASSGANAPFVQPYEPLAHKFTNNPDWALHSVERILEIRGYDISENNPYLATFTEPQDLGELISRDDQKKYKVTHQIGVEIIDVPEGQSYWRVQHKIKGISAEKESERYFPPREFHKTEKIFGEISGDIATTLGAEEF